MNFTFFFLTAIRSYIKAYFFLSFSFIYVYTTEQTSIHIYRNSEAVVQNIIKFLFHLSKQKEKNIITIPKIINITDTLLANSAIINSSTLALNEVAYEFFFQQTPPEEWKLLREIYTQKEVAFNMLIKFLDNVEVSNNNCCMEVFYELAFHLLNCCSNCCMCNTKQKMDETKVWICLNQDRFRVWPTVLRPPPFSALVVYGLLHLVLLLAGLPFIIITRKKF